MIEIEKLPKEYRVKLYVTREETGKLEWVDTEHVIGNFRGFVGFYENPSCIPDVALQDAAWLTEQRYYNH